MVFKQWFHTLVSIGIVLIISAKPTEEIKDRADKVGDDIGEGVNDIADGAGNAADKAGDALSDALN